MTDAAPAERLVLIDTAGLYFRAFHGMPERDRPAGAPPRAAIRGLLDMLATVVDRFAPTQLVAAWDTDWRPEFRVAAIPSYKAHRVADPAGRQEMVPDELAVQVPVIADLLDALGVTRCGAVGFEADDVIGTLARRAPAGMPVDVVTGDRDLFQVVDDARSVRVVYVARGGVRAPDLVDQAWLSERYAVASGLAYADLAVLRGDPSDGLPGVSGVGEKTAARWLGRFGDLAGIRAAARRADPALTPAQRGKLLAAEDYLDVAPSVVRVREDVPVPPGPYPLPRAWRDPARVTELVAAHDLAGPVGRFARAVGVPGPAR